MAAAYLFFSAVPLAFFFLGCLAWVVDQFV